jgi:hypothetical protein
MGLVSFSTVLTGSSLRNRIVKPLWEPFQGRAKQREIPLLAFFKQREIREIKR